MDLELCTAVKDYTDQFNVVTRRNGKVRKEWTRWCVF
jgi:hypothetical protein